MLNNRPGVAAPLCFAARQFNATPNIKQTVATQQPFGEHFGPASAPEAAFYLVKEAKQLLEATTSQPFQIVQHPSSKEFSIFTGNDLRNYKTNYSESNRLLIGKPWTDQTPCLLNTAAVDLLNSTNPLSDENPRSLVKDLSEVAENFLRIADKIGKCTKDTDVVGLLSELSQFASSFVSKH